MSGLGASDRTHAQSLVPSVLRLAMDVDSDLRLVQKETAAQVYLLRYEDALQTAEARVGDLEKDNADLRAYLDSIVDGDGYVEDPTSPNGLRDRTMLERFEMDRS